MMKELNSRETLRLRICKHCRLTNKAVDKLEEYATELISKELDIVRFIRRQKMYEIAMKLLFTKTEQFLIHNQRKPFVLT